MLRVGEPEHAPLLREAIDSSLEHLRAWLPWAMQEPRTLAQTAASLIEAARLFARGDDFRYLIFDCEQEKVLGAIGLHRRGPAESLEVGYWIRSEMTSRGLATEAAGAVTAAALRVPGIDAVRIECDPANVRSRRIPEKLGFRLVETRQADKVSPQGEPRDTVVYQLSAEG